jgi:hypothetical protein
MGRGYQGRHQYLSATYDGPLMNIPTTPKPRRRRGRRGMENTLLSVGLAAALTSTILVTHPYGQQPAHAAAYTRAAHRVCGPP